MIYRPAATLFLFCAVASAQERPAILVDQLGYLPDEKKIAIIRDLRAELVEVRNTVTNKTVYTGKVKGVGRRDESTGDETFLFDFSELINPGNYQLWIPGTEVASTEFSIGPDVYLEAALSSLQSFYYQRCGIEVSNGSPWVHPPCHLQDALQYGSPSHRNDVVGGWHDAGDYGKFVATGAVSAAFLLYLYELKPSKFVDGQLAIPQAGNSIPDILDEVRWELEWLLKMQREDGGVYHKVSTKKWTGEYLPHRDPDKRYIFEVSSTATGAFAAVTALASRHYQRWDKPFAQQLLRAAVQAWEYLEAHPTIVPRGGFRNPSDVEGGEYGDQQDDDERLWASVELFRTTENKMYHQYVLNNHKRLGGVNYPVSWQRVANFAYLSYVRVPLPAIHQQARAFILGTLTTYSDNLLKRIEANGYRYVLVPDQYYWGSNSVALGHAFDLLQAYEATRLPRYRDAALDQLHYLLGRNTFSQTFITGVGKNPVTSPYHQFSMMLHVGKPVPGLIVGGSNKNSRLRGKVISQFPGRSYEDNEKNYFVNEVAINYTAPFVFLAGYFSDFSGEREQGVTVGRMK